MVDHQEALPAEESATRTPFMFREAAVPEGWPAPTPVGEVQVKHYPAYRAAIAASPVDAAPTQNDSFSRLFNHIKRSDIAMTAPVEMVYEDGPDETPRMRSMAFLYRDTTLGEPGNDQDIEVRDMPAQTVLSIGVRGRYTDERMRANLKALEQWLAEHQGQWKSDGPPRYFGYNSPFVPWFMRYGEVQVPIAPVP